jgi:hypothetical protein
MWHVWGLEKMFRQDFVGTPEGERPLGRPRYRWKDNIKMDIEDVG